MPIRPILYDVQPGEFVELCLDPTGVRVELLEITGIRAVDADTVIAQFESVLAKRFDGPAAVSADHRLVSRVGARAVTIPSSTSSSARGWTRVCATCSTRGGCRSSGEVAVAVLAGELPGAVESSHGRPAPGTWTTAGHARVDRRARPRR